MAMKICLKYLREVNTLLSPLCDIRYNFPHPHLFLEQLGDFGRLVVQSDLWDDLSSIPLGKGMRLM